MTSFITTLPPPASFASTVSILSKDGFNCSLITLPPRGETPHLTSSSASDQLLIVAEGEVAVQFQDGITTMLSKDSALLISAGRAHCVTASSDSGAKVLRIEVPPRSVSSPPIVTFES